MNVDDIDNCLPQTQCEECGFKGCRPYAEAIASGSAEIDLCPPGGIKTLKALATICQKDSAPFIDHVKANTRSPSIAVIRESECIGCTKCIQACPVDAIVGSNKRMHTVVTDLCTGCNLCIEPCPVDCIDIIDIPKATFNKSEAKKRFNQRNKRLLEQNEKKVAHYQENKSLSKKNDIAAKQDYIKRLLKNKRPS